MVYGIKKLSRTFLLCSAAFAAPASAGTVASTLMPSGQYITPTAAAGAVFQTLNPGLTNYPNYRVGQALKTVLSPDGTTLLIMTSGYNQLDFTGGANAGQVDPSGSNEYIFVYNVSGANAQSPVQTQVLQIPNSFVGLVFAPNGNNFYAAGGVSDSIFVFSKSAGVWAQSSTIALNHQSYANNLTGIGKLFAAFLYNGIGFEQYAETAGLAISTDGSTLVAANIGNDSISVINTATGTVSWEYDLRPFNSNPSENGKPGGETPFGVAIATNGSGASTAYVSALRDREVVAVPLGASAPVQGAVTRIKLPGSPNSVLLSPDQSKLYVAQDNSDMVAVIDTSLNSVLEEISAGGAASTLKTTLYTGTSPNGLALSSNGNQLFVTNGGANSVAVVDLATPAPHHVAGLIPTGWYPHSVAVSNDAKTLYIVNGKSDPGPNPGYVLSYANEYIEQLEQAGFLTVPVPTQVELAGLTKQVAQNNNYGFALDAADKTTMRFLRSHIKHVIYIIKENRTFDQILGDLTNGANADPSIVMYPAAVTPNFHAIATNFITLDNFYCSGEVSGDGWPWSTEARESDFGVKTIPPNYANRGFQNDSEGLNRIVDVGVPVSARIASYPVFQSQNLYNLVTSAFPGGPDNLLPGISNDFATDGPVGSLPQQGYLWDAVLRARLSVRDYGMLIDLVRYNIPVAVGGSPLLENPANTRTVMAWPANPTLAPLTDPYFRGFDNAYPDTWRYLEWAREYREYEQNDNLPNLSLVRLMHDHTGNFCDAPPPYTASGCPAAGLNTPELQQSDNDYAVGRLIQTVAYSRYANDTLIFVIEDDAQAGPDHVDAHRSTAYVVGPYVKQNAVITTHYDTVNMVRTIEDVLGTGHLNLNDANAGPMTDIFDITQSPHWSYIATVSPLLETTGLQPIVKHSPEYVAGGQIKSSHDGAWWAARTKGYDWSSEDKIPAAAYNHTLWQGLKGNAPYPKTGETTAASIADHED